MSDATSQVLSPPLSSPSVSDTITLQKIWDELQIIKEAVLSETDDDEEVDQFPSDTKKYFPFSNSGQAQLLRDGAPRFHRSSSSSGVRLQSQLPLRPQPVRNGIAASRVRPMGFNVQQLSREGSGLQDQVEIKH